MKRLFSRELQDFREQLWVSINFITESILVHDKIVTLYFRFVVSMKYLESVKVGYMHLKEITSDNDKSNFINAMLEWKQFELAIGFKSELLIFSQLLSLISPKWICSIVEYTEPK